MKLKQVTIIEFDNYQESRDFRKWVKRNVGKQHEQHVSMIDGQAVAKSSHGVKMMRQYNSLCEVQDETL